MTPISVLLPTANRPAMLRTALRSIAAQTALSAIGEVVVIENLSCRESENVCNEFPLLPIRYIFRDPPLPPNIESGRDALSRIRCERMAILFDDDWWMEHHLENAIDALASHPDAVMSCSTCIWTTGEEKYLTTVFGSFLPWFAASEPQVNHRWILGLSDILVASLINTTFHFSSVVVGREVYVKCIEAAANGNPYDTDRLLAVELGRHGKIVCDSRPQVYIREHKAREAIRIVKNGEALRWWNDSTEKLLSLAQSAKIDLAKEIEARLRSKSVSLEELKLHFGHDCFESLASRGILNFADEIRKKPPLAKRLYRGLMPPLFQEILKRYRIRMQ